ncbi:MAG: phospho-N-acetylmuramoyl-pentapeptide-transferase [Candidatus Pacebacteria bacterium]|nr:phospho-N-acetylmuramoyl-pentapeptide-transferase [Candidatus Paceibacterota bacterium]
MPEVTVNIIKVFTAGIFSFFIAFFVSFPLNNFLYKKKLWKNKAKEKAIDGGNLKNFRKFHLEKETGTPRFGGVLVWGSVTIITFLFFGLSLFFDNYWIQKINFLSREQTWLPLFALISASLVGAVDDLMQTTSFLKIKNLKEGLSLRYRLLLVSFIGMIGALWFYFQLGRDSVYVPLFGDFYIGFLFIPFFIIVTLATYSGGVIDGLDGLAGGVFASIFGAYATIALFQGQIDLATFCLAVIGGLFAFLWFNIPPARFYMGETGVIGLTVSLTVIAFLTNAVIVLPIIAILLVATSGSVIIQLLSKKIRGKQVFLSAPIHHHFEAKGWPHYKVTMRYWIIGVIFAIIGVAIHLLG